MTTNVIIIALVLLAIILCGVTIHLHRKIERIESSIEDCDIPEDKLKTAKHLLMPLKDYLLREDF